MGRFCPAQQTPSPPASPLLLPEGGVVPVGPGDVTGDLSSCVSQGLLLSGFISLHSRRLVPAIVPLTLLRALAAHAQ